MPLYKTITPNSQTVVKIWKITESFNELLEPLALLPDNLERVKRMKSEVHQCGYLSVRHLLRAVGYTDKDLYYDEYGKPHLKNGKHISISHSFSFSAIIVSDFKVGIDIEKQREKIERIAHKFIDYEFQYLDGSDEDYVRKLTMIWCAKEALFKLFATPGLSFKKHTLVIPFTFNESTTTSWIDYNDFKHRYDTHILEFEGFSCAYAIP
jgi:phosphopantetheinyl transferase